MFPSCTNNLFLHSAIIIISVVVHYLVYCVSMLQCSSEVSHSFSEHVGICVAIIF